MTVAKKISVAKNFLDKPGDVVKMNTPAFRHINAGVFSCKIPDVCLSPSDGNGKGAFGTCALEEVWPGGAGRKQPF